MTKEFPSSRRILNALRKSDYNHTSNPKDCSIKEEFVELNIRLMSEIPYAYRHQVYFCRRDHLRGRGNGRAAQMFKREMSEMTPLTGSRKSGVIYYALKNQQ